MAEADDDEFDQRSGLDRFMDFVRGHRLALALAATTGLAVVGLAISLFALTEARRDLMRVSTDIAQLKVSLDLFSRQIQGAGPGGQSLVDLSNRLLILEESWREGQRGQLPPAGGAPAVGAVPDPASPPAGADGAGVANSPLDECIPSGTRFLAMPNDSYPVCGTGEKIALTTIGSGSVVLADGTAIVAGNSAPLNGTACTVAVLSAESDGVAGFAELRITC